MTRTKTIPGLLLAALTLAAGCSFNTKKEEDVMLTTEPSIERAMDELSATPEGKSLVAFIYEHPIGFEYSAPSESCHKLSIKDGKIFLPRELKNSDALLALVLARAAYVYRMYKLSGLEEIVSEEEEAATLFQARTAIGLNLAEKHFTAGNNSARELRRGICTYIMQGSASAAMVARAVVLAPDPECQRPLETLQTHRAWLEKTRVAINEESFFALMNERDLRQVRKGLMTQSEAMANDAAMRAKPPYEIYRYQRMFYERQSGIFSKFETLYRDSLKEDAAWRELHQADILRAKEEFSACNLPE